jgi:hypothetical protein
MIILDKATNHQVLRPVLDHLADSGAHFRELARSGTVNLIFAAKDEMNNQLW